MTTRLKEILDASGLSAATVARAAGMDQSTFSKLLTGKRRMATHWAQRLAPILRVGPSDFFADPGSPILRTIRSDIEERREQRRFERIAQIPEGERVVGEQGDIKIFKSSTLPNATIHGEFAIWTGESFDIDRPPGLSTYQAVQATRCRSDNMAPKFSPGDLVFFELGATLSLGDYVILLQHGPSEAFRKVLIYQFLDKNQENVYTFKQFNPEEIISVKLGPRPWVGRILPLEELLGVA